MIAFLIRNVEQKKGRFLYAPIGERGLPWPHETSGSEPGVISTQFVDADGVSVKL